MPYQFDFDSTNRILRGRIAGRVMGEELKAFYLLACELAKTTIPRAALADFSAVTGLKLGPQTLLDLAKLSPVLPDPNLPRVILAPSEEVFGSARIFQYIIEQTRPNVHVVHKLSEACAILGVQRLDFKAIRAK